MRHTQFRQLHLAVIAVACTLAQPLLANEYRADLEIRLGGKFINHWADDPRVRGSGEQVVNYYTSPPGTDASGMSVIVFGGPINDQPGGARGFYEKLTKQTRAYTNLSPTTINGVECQAGPSMSSPAEISYLCHVERYVLLLVAGSYGKTKIDARTQATKLVERLQGKMVPEDYSEILQILRQYRGQLFGDLPDQAIIAALKEREQGLVGPGPTSNLRAMSKEIKSFRTFVGKAVIGTAGALANIPETKTKDFNDLLWDIADAVKDLLPEAAGKLIGVASFFKQAADKMVEVRDTWVIPAQAEALYLHYRQERGPGIDQDSISAYSRLRSGLAQVRSAPEFKAMSEAQFDRVFRGRLEARYQLELAEIQRMQMLADQERIIQRIVQKYDYKIGLIHSTAMEIAARQ